MDTLVLVSISNFPFLSKLIEQLAKGQLEAHLIEGNILNPPQSGSRLVQETETTSVALIAELMLTVGEPSIIILLDLSATWNSDDCQILLSCLRKVGEVWGMC